MSWYFFLENLKRSLGYRVERRLSRQVFVLTTYENLTSWVWEINIPRYNRKLEPFSYGMLLYASSGSSPYSKSMTKRWYLGLLALLFNASLRAVEPMTYWKPRSAGEWRNCCSRRSMYVVHPSLSQKCVASACLVDIRYVRCDASFMTHVIPFPNQEWVSSCTTTSTRLRSPARRAGAPKLGIDRICDTKTHWVSRKKDKRFPSQPRQQVTML